jgi:outer membrane protein assembly factor BamB
MWGKSSSPLIVGDLVVVTGGDGHGPALLAFRRADGATAWADGSDRGSYASPVLGTVAGRRQILTTNARSVTGHDPTTGAILWEFAWPGDFPKVSQPVIVGERRVLLAAGYGIGTVLLELSSGDEGRMALNEVWRNRNLKTKFTNPVVHGGHAYGLDDGILVCIELESGAREWKDGRYGHGQVLLVGDLLLVQAESGMVALVEASPVLFRELTRFHPLRGKTWNYPALSGEYLFVRNDQEAACYRLPTAQAPLQISDLPKGL